MKIDGREVDLEARRIEAQAQVGTRVMRSLVRHHAQLLELKVKRRAKALFGQDGVTAGGNPLTQPHTGDYIRSWSHETRPIPGGAEADVGTNAVQGPRLEYGFAGTDAAGRTYHQPPYPHLRPSAIETQMEFFTDVGRAVATKAAGR